MINQVTLPEDLKKIIANEQIDFIVKAKKNNPVKKALSLFFFSFFWLFILGIGLSTSLKSHFKGKIFNLKTIINVLKNTDYSDNTVLIMLLFVGIGVAVFLLGIYTFLQRGGYFVATKLGLIKYRNGEMTITDWNQFSGSIKITNRNLYSSVAMELITGKEVSRYNDSNDKRYVPNVIHIVGVEKPIEIANKCKFRIDENSAENAMEIKF